MSFIISDGRGNGFNAGVTDDNRLLTNSKTQDAGVFAAVKGEAFGVNTEEITLTTAGVSAVFFLKNNEDSDIIVFTLVYQIGASVGGSGNGAVSIVRNPTSLSGAVNTPVFDNLNFGSTNVVDVISQKGAEGSTFTGGTNSAKTFGTFPLRVLITTPAIVLPRGSSLGVKVQPPAGNTSCIVGIASTFFFDGL